MLRIDPELERSISRIVDVLAAEFAGRISRLDVAACVDRNKLLLVNNATLPDYIPVLLVRNCRQQLRMGAAASPRERTASHV